VDRTIINVGSGRELSINQLIKKVEQATGREVHPLHNAAESGGVSRLVADISLARRKLGFNPKTDIDKGLRLLLERDPQFKSTAKA
jgi:UDP-glucose 4-epimerase